jgi:hypothetical protein
MDLVDWAWMLEKIPYSTVALEFNSVFSTYRGLGDSSMPTFYPQTAILDDFSTFKTFSILNKVIDDNDSIIFSLVTIIIYTLHEYILQLRWT